MIHVIENKTRPNIGVCGGCYSIHDETWLLSFTAINSIFETMTAGRISYWRHDDVIKWKHFPRYWPFVREIHWSPVNSQHKGQWCRTLMFSLICARINCWVNNREAGDLRRHRAHYDVIVMVMCCCFVWESDLSCDKYLSCPALHMHKLYKKDI